MRIQIAGPCGGIKAGLLAHIATLKSAGKLIAETRLPSGLDGHFVAPVAFEIGGIHELNKEHFGPILHLVRFAASAMGSSRSNAASSLLAARAAA